MNKGIERYFNSKNELMAILVRKDYKSDGIEFLTDNNSFMQMASMSHPEGHIITPHRHNKCPRIIDYTCEALVMKEGSLEVFLYEKAAKLHEFIINEGDVLVLVSGGHGFKCLSSVSMIEIKQGPFVGPSDKTRFEGGLS